MACSKDFDLCNDCGVEVRIIGEPIGKGLFATRNFKEGETVFEENPLVSCQFLWNQAYGYLACDYCMRPLESAEENARRLTQNSDLILPHPECCEFKNPCIECPFCDTSYCSESCRQNAMNQHHEVLCLRTFTPNANHPLVALQEAWKHMHYPPETACIMLLARIIATVRQAKDKEGALALFMQFCHRTVNEEEEIAHKLLGSEFSDQLETLRKMMDTALGGPDVDHWLSPEGFRSFVALVGTNGQGIGTSSLSQWVRNCDEIEDTSKEAKKYLDEFIYKLYEKLDEEAGGFLNNEGSGLYPLQSSCNHSCQPNAMPTFPYNNFQLVMTAIRDIREGEQICVSYLDECILNRSRHSRQKILRENYIFNCSCTKCESQADDPEVTSDEDMDDDEEGDDEAAAREVD